MSALHAFVGNKHAVEQRENAVITEALRILDRRLSCYGVTFMSPDDCKAFFRLKQGELSTGDYGILFLDRSRKSIHYEEFGEHLNYRKIIKVAIEVEAACVIVAQSCATVDVTTSIKQMRLALSPVDIDVLDYMLVQGQEVISCFERGLFS